MNTLLVGYDLNRQGQNYSKIIELLESYGTYWHHLDSTWLIKTDESTSTVRNKLTRLMDSNDELLVVNVTGDPWTSSGFSDRGKSWLEKHL